MKLRYFYKLDSYNKQPVPASNIRRTSKPTQGGIWKEIINWCCEVPEDIACNCDGRFFVQVDRSGNPVDYTLVKRELKPRPEDGIFYRELTWVSPCCVDEG